MTHMILKNINFHRCFFEKICGEEVRNMIYVHIEHYLYCNWEKKKEKKNHPSVGPPWFLVVHSCSLMVHNLLNETKILFSPKNSFKFLLDCDHYLQISTTQMKKKKIKKSIYVIWKIFKEPILHHIKYEKNET